MKLTAILLASLFAASLAGCAKSSGDVSDVPATSLPELATGKGAITGLVIDDRYRPVPDAQVFLQPVGLTTTSDALGQFSFLNVNPGVYILKVDAEGHEAAPKNVDVVAGEYTEVEAQARRLFSENGAVVTLQASVFIPCAVSSPAITVTVNCMGDLSGDSYRTGFTTRFNKTSTTWLVGEVLFNKVDNYMFVLRPDGLDSVGDAFNYTIIHGGDYGRVVLQADNKTYQQNPWNPGKDLQATVFFSGQTDGATGPPICPGDPAPCVAGDDQDGFGAGATFAIKATMILTAFVGTPEVDPRTYAVMRPVTP